MKEKIRVLIVDDSLFVRGALMGLLRDVADIEIVGKVDSGRKALEFLETHPVDVMTLDVKMPEMSGIEVLKVLAKRAIRPKVIMISSYTTQGSEDTFEALEEGAIDFIDKNSVHSQSELHQLKGELISKIRIAAAAETGTKLLQKNQTKNITPTRQDLSAPRWLVVIGASTGGPMAIRRFFSAIQAPTTASFLIIQHMPPGFTEGFVKRLVQTAYLPIKLAQSNQLLYAHHAYAIPSGSDVEFDFSLPGKLNIQLIGAKSTHLHRPNYDHTLMRAADVYGKNVIAVTLSGMGDDGAIGIKSVARVGGIVLVQDADSCTIYGMPKAIKNAVHVDYQAEPEQLGLRVMNLVAK